MALTKAYEEIAEFIGSGPSIRSVSEFQPTEATKQRVWTLIGKEKSGVLTEEEKSELDHFAQVEHIMRLAKAIAAERLGSDPRP